jgi:hypothetical protein
MARHTCIGLVSVALVGAIALGGPAYARQGADAAKQAMSAAASAAKASPDLVGALAKEIGGTSEQAAGAAGAIFGLAKSKLKPDEFSQVAKAVPGMDMLLKAAPAMGAAAGGGAAGAVAGAATGLASLGGAFSKLGLKPDMVSKAIPVLTSFVTKSGGASVGSLLAGVLK